MLIKNDRQTDSDLDFYRHYDYIDSIANIPDSKIINTINIINDYGKSNKCYCSVSWGKDSIVLAHICSALKLRMPYVWIKETPMSNPDCVATRDLFLKQFDVYSYHEFTCDYGNINYQEYCDKNGNPSLFYDICSILQKNFGSRITGIRNDESNKRKLRYLHFGSATKNTCAPLSLWSISEIFAYIYKNNIPLNPAYGQTIGGKISRDKIRVDCLGGFEGGDSIRKLWEKTYYPDILNKINSTKSIT